MTFRSLSLLLALCGLFFPSSKGDATVTTCTEAGLRGAIASGGEITFECATNLITLTRPIVIDTDTTLFSTNAVSITGGNATRLFVVNPGVRFTINGIGIFSGRHTSTNRNDGGIAATAGAAIYNDGGIVTLIRSRFENHTVIGITGAPGANATGVNGLDGEDGEEGGDAAGAAVFNNGGSLVVSNCVFTSNTATAGPGGNGGNGGSGLGGNGGDAGKGGAAGGAAVYSQGGTIALYNSVFTNNVATGAIAGNPGAGTGLFGFPGEAGEAGDAVGAAVSGDNVQLVVSGCTFASNRAEAADGGNGLNAIRNLEGMPGGAGGDAAGGAIFAPAGLLLTNSTFFSNSTIAGNGGNGGVGGSVSFGSDGGDGGDGGVASGGAIETALTAMIVNCTFADNTLTPGEPGVGGAGSGIGDDGDEGAVGAALGGAIYNTGTLNLANTIMANSDPMNLRGSFNDLGGNLSTDASALFPSGKSFRMTNPRLRALANNGGPTPTMALSTNSPAIDRGIALYCPPVDQRGSNRVGMCDSGAFEFRFSTNTNTVPTFPTNATLSVSLGTNGVRLAWPLVATNLVLQVNTNLARTNWTIVSNVQTSPSNVFFQVNPSTNSPQGFFRLIGSTNIFRNPVTNSNSGPPLPPSN